MKRSVFVLALVLVFLVALCGNVFSTNVPYGFRSPETGDDHTWGGDFQVGGDQPVDSNDGPNDGFRPLDVFITHIIFKWLGFDSVKTQAEPDHTIQHQIDTTTPDDPVTSNNRGNL